MRTGILHVLEYHRIVERGTVALAVQRTGEREVADLEFHLVLARASRNPIVVKVNAVIRDILSASMEEIAGALGTRDGLEYHQRILQAFKARDFAAAEEGIGWTAA